MRELLKDAAERAAVLTRLWAEFGRLNEEHFEGALPLASRRFRASARASNGADIVTN